MGVDDGDAVWSAVVAVGGGFVGAARVGGITNCVGVGGSAVTDGASVGSSINSATEMRGALQARAVKMRARERMRFIFRLYSDCGYLQNN